MSESKHTPGDWQPRFTSIRNAARDIESRLRGESEEAVAANALLLAGAPKLLEACRSLTDAIDAWKNDEDGDWHLDEWLEREEYGECLPRARAAIATATGENPFPNLEVRPGNL